MNENEKQFSFTRAASSTCGCKKANSYQLSFTLLLSIMAFAARSSADDGYWDARFSWPGGQGVDGLVNAVAVSGADVYVGGKFTMAGSVNAANIAKWNGSSWSALGAGVNDQVYAVAVYGSTMYAGGKFTQAGSVPVNYIAKWDGSSWSALGSGLNNGVGGHVYALAITQFSPPVLYVGGVFGAAVQSDGSLLTVNFIARWFANHWSTVGGGVNSTVYGVAVYGNDVYVGGEFTTANYYTFTNVSDWVTANHIAKYTGSWSALTDSYNHNGVNGHVNAIAVNGSDVYVGGRFTDRGNNIARFDGSVPLWRPVGGGVNDIVQAIARSGTNLYAAGGFTQAGGANASEIARWDGNNWATLSSGLGSFAVALGAWQGHVYVGGGFSTAGRKSSSNFAIWHEASPEPPQIMDFRLNGADCLIGFTVQHGREYTVERCSKLTSNSWASFYYVLSDTSRNITAVDPAAALTATNRFYRVRSQ